MQADASRHFSARGVAAFDHERTEVLMSGQDLKVQRLDASGERLGRVVRRELPAGARSSDERVAQIRGVVLLGGSIRASGLQSSIGRSVFDLPISDNCSLLQRWCDEGVNLLRGLTIPRLQIRLVIDQASAAPNGIAHDSSVFCQSNVIRWNIEAAAAY